MMSSTITIYTSDTVAKAGKNTSKAAANTLPGSPVPQRWEYVIGEEPLLDPNSNLLRFPGEPIPPNRYLRRQDAREFLEAVGLERVCEHIADGVLYSAIAAHFHVSQGMLHAWLLGETTDTARQQLVAQARELRADTLADMGRGFSMAAPERTDKGTVDPGYVSLVKTQTDAHQWAAGRMNPRRYGNNSTMDLGNKDDKPFQTTSKPDLSKLTEEELKLYIALQTKIEGGQ